VAQLSMALYRGCPCTGGAGGRAEVGASAATFSSTPAWRLRWQWLRPPLREGWVGCALVHQKGRWCRFMQSIGVAANAHRR